MTPLARRPSAFTLVELLVVASIMLLMFGLVLSGARPSPRGQIRQAAQSLASLLMAAQSQGLGNAAGAGLVLQSGVVAGLPATMSTTVAAAALPPFLTGTTGPGFPPSNPRVSGAAVTLVPLNGDADEVQHGYKIRFGGAVASGTYPYQPPTAWMSLAAPPAGGGSSCTGMVRLRYGVATSGNNVAAVWPEPTKNASGGNNPLDFQIARYPVIADTLLDMPKTVAVDLRYSGLGEDGTTVWNQASWLSSGTAVSGWGTLAGKGSIAIVFDSVGGVDAVMQNIEGPSSLRSQPPIDPVEPIYILVTARSEIDEPSFSALSSPQAMWVAIHPQTGRVTTAPNVPQTGTDAAALRAARAKARAAAMSGK
jgi:type II secretory pathway pseudopilin PulG